MIFEILFFHYVGDVLLQSDRMRSEKWNNSDVLFEHVLVYTSILAVTAFFLGIPWWWVILNGLIHWAVDCVSSYYSHQYFSEDDIRNGMNVVVADQLIHIYCLWATLKIEQLL